MQENQDSIAYYEVFAPIWANSVFERFANADGTIDIEAIEMCNPELLYLIGYRIPTEAKYSIAPCKIMGFLPREAGDAIMLPYEITRINDSDFDIDKEYAIRKEFSVKTRPKEDIIQSMLDMIEYKLEQRLQEYKAQHPDVSQAQIDATKKSVLKEQSVYVKKLVGNPNKYKDSTPAYRKLYDNYYKKTAYYTEAPMQGKLYRDNKVFDMSWAVYTHRAMIDQMLNPGGFDKLKHIGYTIAAFKKAQGREKYEDLKKEGLDALKDRVSSSNDLTWIGTQLLFYRQASAAASLIGISAVNKISHAILEHDHLYIDLSTVCLPFTIAGHRFDGLVRVDDMFSFDQSLMSKTLGSYVGASADAVKEPVFDLVNINTQTVNAFFTLLRMGMPEEAALKFLSADIITKIVQQQSIDGGSINNIVADVLSEFETKYGIKDDSPLKTEEITEEDLDNGLLGTDDKVSYKILLTFAKLMGIYEIFQDPNFVTRFNSIRNAPGPLALDNLITEHKVEAFNDKGLDASSSLFTQKGQQLFPVTAETVFDNHPILRKFSQAQDVARQVLKDEVEYSEGFAEALDIMPEYISDALYNDKELFSKFSDFYKTYACFASGMINENHLDNYIKGFPSYFIKQKEKYGDNPFVQAIKTSVPQKTGRPELVLNVAGLDQTYISDLQAAWVDFHKQNP